ncbi:MAG: rhomboid family intramembrane serine protease [Ignavibacteria bacterium]|nr:rhomboid family intramembrane serine protease [Ignavibacteria bacterium]
MTAEIQYDLREDKEKIIYSLIVSVSFLMLLWIVKIFDSVFQFDLFRLGVYPRHISGLIGILFSPLIHKDFSHLSSNSTTLLFLFFFLLYFYRTSAYKVFWIVYFFDGIFVWILGRESYHIGASGLVYGFVTYLFFAGLLRKDKRSIAVSLLITFLYGGMVWGIFPTDIRVSFEAHIGGALVGIVCALIFRNTDIPPKYEWEDEQEEIDEPYENNINPDDIKIRDDARPKYFN